MAGNTLRERIGIDVGRRLKLEDAIAWIEDQPLPRRPSFGPRRVTVRVGDALSLDGRLESYHRDRRQAVQELTAAVQQALQGLIGSAGS